MEIIDNRVRLRTKLRLDILFNGENTKTDDA